MVYDVIIIGDDDDHNMLLYKKFIELKINCLAININSKDKLRYKEVVQQEDLSFTNEYLEFFNRSELVDSINQKLTNYTPYNIKLQITIQEQLEKIFSNMMINFLPSIEFIKDETFLDHNISVHPSDILSIKNKDVSTGNSGCIVATKLGTYESKYLIFTSRIDLNESHDNELQNNELQNNELQNNELPDNELPDNKVKYNKKRDYGLEVHIVKLKISQKAQNCVFTLNPHKTDQSISIEIINNFAYILSIGFTEKDANVYFEEIATMFKVNPLFNLSSIRYSDVDKSTYTYQQFVKATSYDSFNRRMGTLSFEHIQLTNTIIYDESNIRYSPLPLDSTYTFYILSSVFALKIAKQLHHNDWFIRGTFNNWKPTKMTSINNYIYCYDINTDDDDENVEIKIDNGGWWIESYPLSDSNFIVPKGDITIYFNSLSKSITTMNKNEKNKRWYIRGSFNDWGNNDMLEKSSASSYDQQITINVTNPEGSEFKIDNGNWTESYPEENLTLYEGKSIIKFNIQTKEIQTISLDNSVYLFDNYHQYLFQKPQLFNNLDIKKECLGFGLLDEMFTSYM